MPMLPVTTNIERDPSGCPRSGRWRNAFVVLTIAPRLRDIVPAVPARLLFIQLRVAIYVPSITTPGFAASSSSNFSPRNLLGSVARGGRLDDRQLRHAVICRDAGTHLAIDAVAQARRRYTKIQRDNGDNRRRHGQRASSLRGDSFARAARRQARCRAVHQ